MISLRYKVLAVLASILVAAVLAHLLLATSLFTRDRLAYTFDLNSSLSNTLAEEVRAGLDGLTDKLLFYASVVATTEVGTTEAGTSGEGSAAGDSGADAYARALLKSEPDLVAITFAGRQIVASSNVSAADLAEAQKRPPSPAERSLENVSLAPDLALWRLSLRTPQGLISAVLKPNRFLRMFGEARAFSAFLVDSRGNVLLHPSAKPIIERANWRGLSIVKEATQGHAARGAQVFTAQNGEAAIGAFAQVPVFDLAVITETPENEAQRATVELVRRTTLFAIGIVLLSFIVSIVAARSISSPLQRLTSAMSEVASGDFHVNVASTSNDEVGVLSTAFNRMARELRERDERISQAREELANAEKMATLGVLAAEITHEVKNPLTAIVGFAQLGKVCEDPKELREYMESIETQTKRAKDMLDTFLRYTRQEHVPEDVDLNQVVRDALKLMRTTRAHTVLSPEAAVVKGNANQLQQVLLNLILNAEQAMETKPGTLTITTTVTDKVRLSVRDTGAGMSADTKKALFKPFFTTKAKGKGTGLGLSVSHSIIQQHAGEWHVESELGLGTTFTITLARADVRGQV